MTDDLLAIDIGGTHARFALASLGEDGAVSLGRATTLTVADHPDFDSAWACFAAAADRPMPDAVAIAVAGVPDSDHVALTNNDWVIDLPRLRDRIAGGPCTVLNDFAAIARAVPLLGPATLAHLCGPDAPLPDTGVLTICGPGTGLGVAQLFRGPHGDMVVPTVGGHVGFAPVDPIEDALLLRLRGDHSRVSTERVCAGPGLGAIYGLLADREGLTERKPDIQDLWRRALAGADPLAETALDRFCLILAAVAGDLALAHGAVGVVIAGGLALRIGDRLIRPFGERFAAKGRFRSVMEGVPVKLVTHPQPGLLGAAAAFAQQWRSPASAPGRNREILTAGREL